MKKVTKFKVFVAMIIAFLIILQVTTSLQYRKHIQQEYKNAVRDFSHNLHHANLYMEIALENKNDKELFLKNVRYTAMWLKGTRVAFNNLNYEANKQGIQFSMDYIKTFNLINLDTFIEMNDNNLTNVNYLESTYQKINPVYQTLNEQTLLNNKI